jgi:hypothetical protein
MPHHSSFCEESLEEDLPFSVIKGLSFPCLSTLTRRASILLSRLVR